MKPAEIYILNQPQEYQEIIYYVCSVIEQEAPEAVMLFKWKIPFYYIGKKPFCFINVSLKKKYVDIGFFYGNKISKNQAHLTSDNRTQVKSLRYFQLNTIPDKILRAVIQEAITNYQ
jgi:hypothetical protein